MVIGCTVLSSRLFGAIQPVHRTEVLNRRFTVIQRQGFSAGSRVCRNLQDFRRPLV